MVKVFLKNALLAMCLGLLYIMLFSQGAQYLTAELAISPTKAYLLCAALTTIVMVLVLVAKQGPSDKAPAPHNGKPPLPL